MLAEAGSATSCLRLGLSSIDSLDLNQAALDRSTQVVTADAPGLSLMRCLVGDLSLALLENVSSACKALGSLAKVKIGIVTGANNFFVIEPKNAAKLKLSARFLQPLACRAHHVPGIDLLVARCPSTSGSQCSLSPARRPGSP